MYLKQRNIQSIISGNHSLSIDIFYLRRPELVKMLGTFKSVKQKQRFASAIMYLGKKTGCFYPTNTSMHLLFNYNTILGQHLMRQNIYIYLLNLFISK